MINKRYLFVLASIVTAVGYSGMPALAQEVPTDNLVQMVTYFPVPYAAFNNLYITEKCDVGLRKDSTFTLTLGDSACPGKPLDVSDVYLRHITDDSALKFQTDIYTPTATFGWYTADPANQTYDSQGITLHFLKNLRAATLSDDRNHPVKRMDTEEANITGSMYLREKKSGADTTGYVANAALPGCADPVTWQSLALGGDTGSSEPHWFLVCGNPTQAPLECSGDTEEHEGKCMRKCYSNRGRIKVEAWNKETNVWDPVGQNQYGPTVAVTTTSNWADDKYWLDMNESGYTGSGTSYRACMNINRNIAAVDFDPILEPDMYKPPQKPFDSRFVYSSNETNISRAPIVIAMSKGKQQYSTGGGAPTFQVTPASFTFACGRVTFGDNSYVFRESMATCSTGQNPPDCTRTNVSKLLEQDSVGNYYPTSGKYVIQGQQCFKRAISSSTGDLAGHVRITCDYTPDETNNLGPKEWWCDENEHCSAEGCSPN